MRQRVGEKKLGFGQQSNHAKSETLSKSQLLSKVQPEDLLKFGLIPEFIGRLPLLASLQELDEDALVRVLVEPRNALTKQYKKMLDSKMCSYILPMAH